MTHGKLRRLTTCAVFAAILCICSPIVLPLGGPVPFAMQIFGVMLCAVTLDYPTAQISVLLYLLLGLFLPIFSGGNTGLTALPGPTGGYIWSYLLMVPAIRVVCSVPTTKRWTAWALAFAGCVLAAALCYLCGTVQFCLVTGRRFVEALGVCVLPFVGFDLIKALAASFLGVELRKVIRKVNR